MTAQSARVPVGANVLLGIVAMVPLHSAWWLLNHRIFGGGFVDGQPSTLFEVCAADCDRVGLAGLALAVTGALVLLAVLVVDVLIPSHRRKPLRPWLMATLLIPVPYVLFQGVSFVLS
ncbi:hypothetical protein [Streptomyces sp. NPDC005907]|uniref:hypothetical protein n=1 Tax=Streptomyces sp. NPDC005907 TaxID=3154571 RepID=UPI0033F8D094